MGCSDTDNDMTDLPLTFPRGVGRVWMPGSAWIHRRRVGRQSHTQARGRSAQDRMLPGRRRAFPCLTTQGPVTSVGSVDNAESAAADVPGSTVGSGSGLWTSGVGAGGDCSGALCSWDAGGGSGAVDSTGAGGGTDVVSSDGATSVGGASVAGAGADDGGAGESVLGAASGG